MEHDLKLSAEQRRFKALYEKAMAAAVAASDAAKPAAMVVGTPKNMMASLMGGDDGGFREDRPTYVVSDGPCGFAWVTLYAERGGESRRFVNTLRKLGLARHSEYEGGYLVHFTMLGGQSYQRKTAAAHAFAEVLRGEVEGLRAYGQSRLD
jgi:hypothetical protein